VEGFPEAQGAVSPYMNRSTTRRAGRLIVGALTAIVLLSGCIKETISANISTSAKVSGVVTYGYNRRALEELGFTKDLNSVTSKKPKLPKGVAYKLVTTKDFVTLRYTLKNVTPDVFSFIVMNAADPSGTDSTKVLTKDGDLWKFNLGDSTEPTVDTTVAPPTTEPSEDSKQIAAILAKYPPRITIALTFPGDVQSTDQLAVVSGKTVSWDLSPKEGDPDLVLSATANLR
jgi:hypothetical protein